jgi:hypothetical protein
MIADLGAFQRKAARIITGFSHKSVKQCSLEGLCCSAIGKVWKIS